MNKSFSVYLDFVRFGSAALVLYYHASFPKFLAWLPWADVGHEAVITFFVLSGFVIAHSHATKDKTLRDYVAARVSRVFAVLIPVLLLSVVLFYVGYSLKPAVYETTLPTTGAALLAFAKNLLLLNQNWFQSVPTFSNAPIWSLCYEGWYYVFFAALAFGGSSLRKVGLVGVLFAIAGPKILILFPIWLLGYWLYSVIAQRQLSIAQSVVCAVAPVLAFLVLYAMGVRKATVAWLESWVGDGLYQLNWSHQFLFDYVVATLVAIHFVGAYGLLRKHPDVLSKWSSQAKWLALQTFPLYLVHFPLLHFFAAWLPHDPQNKVKGLILLAAVAVCVLVTTFVTEQLRPFLRRLLSSDDRSRLAPVTAS
jgi:peptidoglycan/LPS O-acetylase OafA/YrhL